MHVDEFIEKYTECELEKIQRSSVIERFSDKVEVGKIGAHSEMHVNSGSRSPNKQRPINRGKGYGF